MTITWSSTALLEISAPGVTKARRWRCSPTELGVDAEDVMAFGDMPNDLPMLAWAGTSYAMAERAPERAGGGRPRRAGQRRRRCRAGAG